MDEAEIKCQTCFDEYPADYIGSDGICRHCARKATFSAFALACGLTRFPDPAGERYVYRLNGKLAGKKVEETDFIDELWDALVRTANGDCKLLLK